MKLWILRPRRFDIMENNPWDPWYDRTFGFVIRAETEGKAREIAHDNGGMENYYGVVPWRDPNLSTCEELTTDGETELIIKDEWSA